MGLACLCDVVAGHLSLDWGFRIVISWDSLCSLKITDPSPIIFTVAATYPGVMPMEKPYYRPRRLRRNEAIRSMVRETRLSPRDLLYPFFVCPGKNIKKEIGSMPGVFNFSIDVLVEECRSV